jgi:hypothetical protein
LPPVVKDLNPRYTSKYFGLVLQKPAYKLQLIHPILL